MIDRDFGGELSVEPELEIETEPDLPAAIDDGFSLEGTREPELELAAEPMPAPEAEFSLMDTEVVPEVVQISEPEPVLLEVEPEPLPEVDLFAEAVQAIEVSPELPAPAAVPAPVLEAPEEEMSESLFADELLSLVEGAFKDSPLEDPTPGAAQDTAAGGGNQIVVSPLFKDFSVDELVAVIQGLTLLTYEPGEIILMEGDPGHSLYMLSSGTVRAMRRNAQGRQATVGELAEGAFFGEMSILTGKPRTATVVAATYCELLELDRETLDRIVKTHPRVLDILKEFAAARQKH